MFTRRSASRHPIIAQGSLGTYGVSGPVLTYAAGATPGADATGAYKITKGGIDSPHTERG